MLLVNCKLCNLRLQNYYIFLTYANKTLFFEQTQKKSALLMQIYCIPVL